MLRAFFFSGLRGCCCSAEVGFLFVLVQLPTYWCTEWDTTGWRSLFFFVFSFFISTTRIQKKKKERRERRKASLYFYDTGYYTATLQPIYVYLNKFLLLWFAWRAGTYSHRYRYAAVKGNERWTANQKHYQLLFWKWRPNCFSFLSLLSLATAWIGLCGCICIPRRWQSINLLFVLFLAMIAAPLVIPCFASV